MNVYRGREWKAQKENKKRKGNGRELRALIFISGSSSANALSRLINLFQPQVCWTASLGSITTSDVLFALKIGAPSQFCPEKASRGLREERVYKLSLILTPERCETILAYRNTIKWILIFF